MITVPSPHHHGTTVSGETHTLAWTDAGELFTWGVGGQQLGHGSFNDVLVPRRVEALAGEKVVGGAAGNMHLVVFTEAGALFTFGWGDHHQLGHGRDSDERLPRLVQFVSYHTGSTALLDRTDYRTAFKPLV